MDSCGSLHGVADEAGIRLDRPIVLLCSERSGSNLIAKMFDAHPHVCAPGAAHLFRLVARFAAKFPDHDVAVGQLLRIFTAKMSSWLLDGYEPHALQALLRRADSPGEMAAALYREEAACARKPHVLLKENSVHEYLSAITAVAHRPRFLFMVRDPRDMALSWQQAPALRGGIVRATQRWISDQLGYLRLVSALPAQASWAFVRYEDLLRDTEAELRRVCAELALEYDPNMLSFHRNSRSARTDAERSFIWRNLSEPVLQDNLEKYRDQLGAPQIAYIEGRTGSLLQTFGYAISAIAAPLEDSLDQLESRLLAEDPYDKPAFLELPESERLRFQNWSRLFAELDALPCVLPGTVRGRIAAQR